MRVVRAMRFGGPEVLMAGDAPDPVAGPGQVVVEVAAAEILFLDTQLRAGWGREYFPLDPPYVPGVAWPASSARASTRPGSDDGWSPAREARAPTPAGATRSVRGSRSRRSSRCPTVST